MAEAPGTLEGWFVLHDFRRLDWARWHALNPREQAAILQEFEAYMIAAEKLEDAPEGSSGFYSVVGHKADILMLHLRPTIEELGALERAFNRTRMGGLMTQSFSYLSVTELSLYEAQARGGGGSAAELAQSPAIQARLKPQIPDKPYICFYPMSKRRGESVNWYTAGMEERRAMMRQHGATGQKYREQVTQMITGSTGLDDWEWGVTLFSSDGLSIKKLVYEMRWDDVTAKYGEFGPFLVGTRLLPQKVREMFLDA